MLETTVKQLGPMQARQWNVAIIAGLTILSWVLLGDRLDLAVISLLGAVALFVYAGHVVGEAEKRIYWNIVLMYGGAIALGVVIDKTGAARWLVERLVGGVAFPPSSPSPPCSWAR
ncbi:MAG: anion permease [Gemmatimonadetes bacterium]|nr:anion permease [Gemmatimonadota bacterium]